MWKKIHNYKFHLKDLKFMLWLFLVIGFFYAYEFFSGLMFHQEFRGLKLICTIIMIMAFRDTRKKLKNNDYRTA
ncbi:MULTISPECIES: hypothetical protein [Bacillus]|uniref:hypothetical protein n=1 Tax=Bacillus TaxID=1386 RepID=UPI000B43B277|nr:MULTISPECIES: hypothetical protein [Bacillus cereus group]MCQ6360435.1 hypothetical protein [Bacillus cereus]QWH20785.1 hypothetical protein EXW62_27780 [Bacillus mycoides]CAH2465718.1 hypothetical protein ACOSJ1_EBGNOMHC_05707 [Bacillus mycoides KBAB4]